MSQHWKMLTEKYCSPPHCRMSVFHQNYDPAREFFSLQYLKPETLRWTLFRIILQDPQLSQPLQGLCCVFPFSEVQIPAEGHFLLHNDNFCPACNNYIDYP